MQSRGTTALGGGRDYFCVGKTEKKLRFEQVRNPLVGMVRQGGGGEHDPKAAFYWVAASNRPVSELLRPAGTFLSHEGVNLAALGLTMEKKKEKEIIRTSADGVGDTSDSWSD